MDEREYIYISVGQLEIEVTFRMAQWPRLWCVIYLFLFIIYYDRYIIKSG